MKRLLNITIKKRCQIPGGRFSLYSHGFMKLRFKALRERWHDWSKAGDGRIICLGKCAPTPIPQRVQFLSHMSPMQGKQHLTEAGEWERWQAALRLAPSETTPHAPIFHVQPFELARAAFTIYLSFPLLCTDGICQFIGMVSNLLQRWIVTYKHDLL